MICFQEAGMNADLYTKGVLSVIAACLVWLCFSGLIPGASAQVAPDRPVRVVIVDETGTSLVGGQGLRVNLGPQALPVSIAGQPVLVEVIRTPPTPMPVP
jgi:hypothetical protein